MKITRKRSLALAVLSNTFLLALAHNGHSTSDRLNFGPNIANGFGHSLHKENALISDFKLSSPVLSNHKDIAIDFLLKLCSHCSAKDLKVRNAYRSKHSGVWHVYVVQTVDGMEVVNGVANVNIDRKGRILSYGNSLYSPSSNSDPSMRLSLPQVILSTPHKQVLKKFKESDVKLTPGDAVAALSKFLHMDSYNDKSYEYYPVSSLRDGEEGFKVSGVQWALSDVPARLKWIQTGDEAGLKLIWDLEVEMENNWYHACIDTTDGTVHQLVDWTSDASYNVYPLGVNDPLSGERQLVVDPEILIASPLGWHDQGRGRKFNVTAGNNVYAQENTGNRYDWESNRRPSSETLDFDFPVDLTLEPRTYEAAAVTNLFYWCNSIHDLFYVYGFDESAGNFQVENFERGGRSSDPVVAHAQDGSGYNNANFATPPDGSSGRMRMYRWTQTSPMRDGDLEGGIIMHEYAHGITTRLTGGPADSSCLGWGESGGMGEGWGDFFATILRMTPDTTPEDTFGMGEYSNGGSGIRRYKYSTSKEVNPSMYSYVQRPGYYGVHAKGEVWAEILFNVYWKMVEKWGFNPDWSDTGYQGLDPIFPSTPGEERKSWMQNVKNRKLHRRVKEKKGVVKHVQGGNIKFLQLVVDGLKLQPCRPSFVDARDAIILADEALFDGESKCLLWKAFAERGLGKDAESGGLDGFKVPKKCRNIDD
ncbi:Fungalysin/Thermolysin Extracellular metalloproteinase 5 [Nowakowskiella sp. JEL0078]|nr:Fungalysin/Thermolysin Extracellular metalloproteinase 5 [Nowakowskiella sp. JEL0078]